MDKPIHAKVAYIMSQIADLNNSQKLSLVQQIVYEFGLTDVGTVDLTNLENIFDHNYVQRFERSIRSNILLSAMNGSHTSVCQKSTP